MALGPSDVSNVPASTSPQRRDFLYVATGATALIGSAFAVWPLIDALNPGRDVLALALVEVDLEPLALGQRLTIAWRGRPVFISHRTAGEIERAQADDTAQLIDPTADAQRVVRADWLIVVGVCTHLGCVPVGQAATEPRGDWDGWYCPCHGSHYDTSGRIRKGPAPRNLDIPPYEFLSDTMVRIG